MNSREVQHHASPRSRIANPSLVLGSVVSQPPSLEWASIWNMSSLQPQDSDSPGSPRRSAHCTANTPPTLGPGIGSKSSVHRFGREPPRTCGSRRRRRSPRLGLVTRGPPHGDTQPLSRAILRWRCVVTVVQTTAAETPHGDPLKKPPRAHVASLSEPVLREACKARSAAARLERDALSETSHQFTRGSPHRSGPDGRAWGNAGRQLHPEAQPAADKECFESVKNQARTNKPGPKCSLPLRRRND